MEVLRILIADDHAAVRRSLRSLVESRSEWAFCGEATNGREAVEQTRRLKPDVVLIDMTMPELNGLEATRQILKEAPDTQVLLLTMHQSEELTEEALHAGARGVVLKSGADDMLTRTIDSLSQSDIHLGGRVVGRQRHIAAFFHSRAEELRVLGPFVSEGIKRRERAVHIIESASRDLHLRRLRDADVDVDLATSQGQMDLITWDAIYLLDGRFDQHAMLDRIRQLLRGRADQGFPLSRLVAHMEWALGDPPGVEDLAEYEARVNNVLSDFDDIVVCVYDLTKFPASTIVDVMRAHPAVVIGESLQANPFYTPPDQMVDELHRRSAGETA